MAARWATAEKVHHFLNRAFTQHCESGLSARHHILMVAEDAERRTMREYVRTRGKPRKKFSGNLIHIGKHQEQSLRCGVCRGERACLKRAVDGSGGSGLALHFLKKDCLPKMFFLPLADQSSTYSAIGDDGVMGYMAATSVNI